MLSKTKIIRDIFAAYMSNDREAVKDALADFGATYDNGVFLRQSEN
jgi:hypothetical protein